jgi:hypothetical protein
MTAKGPIFALKEVKARKRKKMVAAAPELGGLGGYRIGTKLTWNGLLH